MFQSKVRYSISSSGSISCRTVLVYRQVEIGDTRCHWFTELEKYELGYGDAHVILLVAAVVVA